jgi:alcohol dehydrogenase, propanol-preferring
MSPRFVFVRPDELRDGLSQGRFGDPDQMRSMRSMRLIAEGQPLAAMSVATPSVGPRSVLVKVEAAGVCHTDIHLISGAYDLGEGRKLSATGGGTVLPLTPGHEIAGRVEDFGREVSGFKKGAQVIVYPWIGCGTCRKCLSGKENLCEGRPGFLGIMKDGGYAEYILVPDFRYLVDAEGLDAPQAATLACSGLTAFSAVRKCSLAPDDLLMIVGAGGLGSTAIQIAKKLAHARVAVVDVDDLKLELATSLGADLVFNTARTDPKDLVSRVKSLNQGRGVDAVVDFVGVPATFALGLRLLGHEGRLVMVGLVGGTAQLPLPVLPLLGAQIRGNFTGTLDELMKLVGIAKKGVVAPVVTGSYGLEEANEVLDRLRRGDIRGRAVLKP